MAFMRILIATPLFPPDVGGPATFSKTLAEELPRRGIEASVVSFGSVRTLPPFIRHVVYFFKVLIAGRRVDLIFAQDAVSVGLPAFLGAKLLGKRFFVKLTGDYAWEQYHMRESNSKEQKAKLRQVTPDEFQTIRCDLVTEVRRFVQKFVARKAEKIIVPSNYLKKILTRFWDIPAVKIEVIYNSFRPPIISGNRATLRALFRFSGTLIVSAGRLVPSKGFRGLIEVMPRILKKIPDATLLIFGEGPQEAELKEAISRRHLGNHVVLSDYVPQDVLYRYLEAADLFVLNAFHETFSHQVLEAMAVGVPVVTTRVGGTPEILEHEKEGLLVHFGMRKELEDAMLRMLTDAALRRRLSQLAQKKVEQFSRDRMVKAVAAALTS